MGNIPIIIRDARLRKGLSQKDLAALIGKSKNVISNWENGRHKPDADQIELLCGILDIPVSDIFKQKEKAPSMELTEDEQRLVSSYRNLSHDNQMKVTGIIEFMFDEESAAKEEYGDEVKRA